MKKYINIIMIPMAVSAAFILVISGFVTIGFMVKIAWNLMFHEVTKNMLIRLLYAVVLFFISAGILKVCKKAISRDDYDD